MCSNERERETVTDQTNVILSVSAIKKKYKFKIIKGPRSAILERMVWEVISEEVTLSRDMFEVGINHDEN